MRALIGWARVALKDLRGDFRRFAVLIACLALGVGTITVVGSVSAALQSALVANAQVLLGGDLEAQLSYRRAEPAERTLLDSLGQVSEVIEVMGRGGTDTDSAFLSLKGVDDRYPLVGKAKFADGGDASLNELLSTKDGVMGAVADPLLLDRLHLKIGDMVKIGEASFALRASIVRLPDSLSSSLQFGIPVLLSVEGLEKTGILAPGVLARYQYKILLAGETPEAATAKITSSFPNAGWQINTPRDATADLSRFFDLFGRFLVIVGLSSLLVGGVGVSSAVSAYITERQRSIATLKALGASGARVMSHFLFQIALLSVAGIALGLLLGTGLAFVALPVIGRMLRLELSGVVDFGTLATAAGFGALTAFAFGYVPLWRARKLRPALLFRSAGSAIEGQLGWRDLLHPVLWLPLGVAGYAMYQLAIEATGRASVVFWYFVGAAASFVALRVAGWVLQLVLRALPAAPNAVIRNALKAIYRPGASAPVVLLSLGLGLALLLLIALLDGNLKHQLSRESIPDAPSFVFMDLFEDEAQSLADWTTSHAAVEKFTRVPMLRGMLSAVNGEAIKDRKAGDPDYQFATNQEVPLTMSTTLPEQSSVTEGQWWPADYSGEPLVSVFQKLENGLGLKLGDELTFLISGEEVKAKIASFRDYAWRNGSINFGFVFTPNAFDDFSVSYLGLLKVKDGTERETQQQLVAAFPDVIFLPVTEAVQTFATILASVTGAVEAIGGLAVASGALVLAGAMIAGRRQREADAVVMKVLGATRGDVIRAYLLEYGLLGLLSALFAAGLALCGTYAFTTYVLNIDFWVDPAIIVTVSVSTIVATIALGTAVTWSALSVRPAGFLRQE